MHIRAYGRRGRLFDVRHVLLSETLRINERLEPRNLPPHLETYVLEVPHFLFRESQGMNPFEKTKFTFQRMFFFECELSGETLSGFWHAAIAARLEGVWP